MVKLRSDVWESIFTHDMERYKRSLYRRMQEIPTLITGPSGTGKELVARAIGLSRYILFDEERTRFARPFDDGFYPINLTALSETLLESEFLDTAKAHLPELCRTELALSSALVHLVRSFLMKSVTCLLPHR